jgi:hypothetical protein
MKIDFAATNIGLALTHYFDDIHHYNNNKHIGRQVSSLVWPVLHTQNTGNGWYSQITVLFIEDNEDQMQYCILYQIFMYTH